MPLITIEGVDGAGKGCQSRLLADRLGAELLSFPNYKGASGQRVKRYLAGEFGEAVHPVLAATLFAVDRLQSKEGLQAMLDEDRFVVCDRYVDSNAAHQGARADSLEVACEILGMEHGELGLPVPDLVVWLDVPVAVCRERLAERASRGKDLHEKDGTHLAKAADMYRRIHDRSGINWARVDGNRAESVVAAEVYQQVSKALLLNFRGGPT